MKYTYLICADYTSNKYAYNGRKADIFLYDVFGRPMYMQNVMGVHTGMIYLDIPKHGRQTIYGMTGNWFLWSCAVYAVLAICSSFVIPRKRTPMLQH